MEPCFYVPNLVHRMSYNSIEIKTDGRKQDAVLQNHRNDPGC